MVAWQAMVDNFHTKQILLPLHFLLAPRRIVNGGLHESSLYVSKSCHLLSSVIVMMNELTANIPKLYEVYENNVSFLYIYSLDRY